jgi:hypothetical protein
VAGVRIAEQEEQPRVLLLSVPYAPKAGDAATLGGLPPSAFVLAAPSSGATASLPPDTSAPPQSSAFRRRGTLSPALARWSYLPL